jgi:hypothetical protein
VRTVSDRPTPQVPGDGGSVWALRRVSILFFEAYTRSAFIGRALPSKFFIKVNCCGLWLRPPCGQDPASSIASRRAPPDS